VNSRKKQATDESVPDIITAQLKLEKSAKENEPTTLALFEKERPQIEKLTQLPLKERLALLDGLYENFDTNENIFDQRQLALKISANSVYGFTGAVVGSLPMRAIAETVTAVGRVAIETKRHALEREFPMPDSMTENGRLRPIVIGGDTDSVFCIFPNCPTPTLAMEYGKKAAAWINEKFFVKPMAVRDYSKSSTN
jgi:DNA polymerase elongation subunit (family B)